MIKLHARAVILLNRPEVSALQIETLTKNKISNIAPRASVSDKNMRCKQSENHANNGENRTKVISSAPKRKEIMKFRYLNRKAKKAKLSVKKKKYIYIYDINPEQRATENRVG